MCYNNRHKEGGDEQMEILVIFLVTFAANVSSAFVVKVIEEKRSPAAKLPSATGLKARGRGRDPSPHQIRSF